MSNLLPIILILASVGMFFGYIQPLYSGSTGSIDTAGKSIQELQSEKKDYTDALTKTANIERVRTGLRDQFNKIDKTKQEAIEKMLPEHIDSVRLIIDINSIAAKYGTSVSKLVLTSSGSVTSAGSKGSTPSAASGGAKPAGEVGAAVSSPTSATTPFGVSTASIKDDRMYKSIKLGFTITATYENFLRFVKELEESLRVVDITSLSFGSDNSSSGSNSSGSQTGNPGELSYTMTIRTYYSK